MSTTTGNGKTGVISRLRLRASSFRNPSRRHLLDRDSFEQTLDVERARAERSDSAFIFVCIRLISDKKGKFGKDEAFARLASVVGERIRISDIAGFRGNGIGMIFPNTPLEAIEDIVQDIDDVFRCGDTARTGRTRDLPEIACDIYTQTSEREVDSATHPQEEELWPKAGS